MKTSTIVWIIIIILVVIGGWYWISTMHNQNTQPVPTSTPLTTNTPTQMPAATPATSPQTTTSLQPTAAAVLAAGTNGTIGKYVVAANGMTLYSYAKDTPGVSNCTSTCAINWPPYTVSATTSLTGTSDVTGKIATIKRTDGTMQITYNGTPLYYYVKDSKPGDTTGQGVGGIWYVIKP